MEYTIARLGKLAGISTRTLRYYHEIGLLTPKRTNSSGYRIYGAAELDKLQQILFYRALDMPLENIKALVNAPNFDPRAALRAHHTRLLQRRAHLDALIATVEKTIDASQRRIIMSDKEKFECFKQDLIDKNEAQFGREARERYGDSAVDQSNAKLKNMTQSQHDEVTALAQTILDKLGRAVLAGDPCGPLAQELADLHRQWLCFYWPSYTKQAHAGVAQMYVDDPRFSAYYDQHAPGGAQFLRDAILAYTGMQP
jgi:DNA-binding transcriptional MerR regulator